MSPRAMREAGRPVIWREGHLHVDRGGEHGAERKQVAWRPARHAGLSARSGLAVGGRRTAGTGPRRAATVSAERGDLVPPKPSAAPSKLLRRFPLLALSVFNQQMSCFIFVWRLCSPFSVPPPTSWPSNLGPAGLPGFLGEGPALRPQQPGRRVRSRGHRPLPLLAQGQSFTPFHLMPLWAIAAKVQRAVLRPTNPARRHVLPALSVPRP